MAVYIDDGGDAGEPVELNLDVDGHSGHDVDSYDPGYDDMLVDTGGGSFDAGPATVDTDGDGHADTAIVHDVNGDTVLYTDSNGDGHADIATEFLPDGEVITATDTESGWMETQHGELNADGAFDNHAADEPFAPPVPEGADPEPGADDAYWSGWAGAFTETGSAPGVVRIDSTTGQWISRN